MKKWQPWTITDGTLQLTEWPDHEPGVVVVEGDIFGAQEVAVVDLEGDIVCHTLPPGVGSHDTDPWDYDDVLRCLFAHIDAHPATHYVLRTLHPERVREVWPGPKAVHGRCPSCGAREGVHGGCRCGLLKARFSMEERTHRPNVTLSLGPLATQADADRLADLCGNVELNAPATPGEG